MFKKRTRLGKDGHKSVRETSATVNTEKPEERNPIGPPLSTTRSSRSAKMSLQELKSRFRLSDPAADIGEAYTPGTGPDTLPTADGSGDHYGDDYADIRLQQIRNALEERSDDEWESLQLRKTAQTLSPIAGELPSIDAAGETLDRKISYLNDRIEILLSEINNFEANS